MRVDEWCHLGKHQPKVWSLAGGFLAPLVPLLLSNGSQLNLLPNYHLQLRSSLAASFLGPGLQTSVRAHRNGLHEAFSIQVQPHYLFMRLKNMAQRCCFGLSSSAAALAFSPSVSPLAMGDLGVSSVLFLLSRCQPLGSWPALKILRVFLNIILMFSLLERRIFHRGMKIPSCSK